MALLPENGVRHEPGDGLRGVPMRRQHDFYETPAWMTRALMRRIHVYDVLEPCAGDGAIAKVLKAEGRRVVTNDVDESRQTDFHLDMTQRESWEMLTYPFPTRRLTWGVTNLPFKVADAIVPLAVEYLQEFATILRLSWLEPTAARQRFLEKHPPKRVIVLPRHDFKGNGQTDSVTSAWFVWSCNEVFRKGIEVVTKSERDELIALERQPA